MRPARASWRVEGCDMDGDRRRGKDLRYADGRHAAPTSCFGMSTGTEGCYRTMAVEVVRLAVADYAEGLRHRHKMQSRKSWVPAGRILHRAGTAESFFKSGRSRAFCDIDGEYLMRETERMVRDELKREPRAVSCFGG
nr:MAG TPA: hypothetical protein [Caudoviricetes sp.]